MLNFCSLFAFVVLHMLMYAANICFWRQYRVNYPFIFGFKQGTELGYREVLLVSFCLAALALTSVLSNLDMEMNPKTKEYEALTELLPLGLVLVKNYSNSTNIFRPHKAYEICIKADAYLCTLIFSL